MNTTTTTIRKLIDDQVIDGYWEQVGKTFRYSVYDDAVDDFRAQFGRFPGARKARRGATPRPATAGTNDAYQDSLGPILEELRAQRTLLESVADDANSHRARISTLEDAVLRLTGSNEHLRQALVHLETAGQHERAASEARSMAVRELADAGTEEAQIANSLAVPDHP